MAHVASKVADVSESGASALASALLRSSALAFRIAEAKSRDQHQQQQQQQ